MNDEAGIAELVGRSGAAPGAHRRRSDRRVRAGGDHGAGYLIDSTTQLLYPGLPTISQFTFIGELLFPLWLLIKSVNVARWQEVALHAHHGAA